MGPKKAPAPAVDFEEELAKANQALTEKDVAVTTLQEALQQLASDVSS